jgi:deoxyribodipyrimidine photolyase-like uncharacterized protein
MHVEKILKLADFLETVPDERFNMNYFFRGTDHDYRYIIENGGSCGTAACVAGWASIRFKEEALSLLTPTLGLETAVKQILDLTWGEVDRLFYGGEARRYLWTLTRKQAISVLRHFARTGTVDWKRFDAEGRERESADVE